MFHFQINFSFCTDDCDSFKIKQTLILTLCSIRGAGASECYIQALLWLFSSYSVSAATD